MKTVLFSIVVLVLVLFSSSGCIKSSKTFEGFFYADSTSSTLDLFIDGQFKGRLPILATRFSTQNDTILKNAIHVTLKGGKHRIQGKDDQGTVLCSGMIEFNINATKSESSAGRQTLSITNQTFVCRLSD